MSLAKKLEQSGITPPHVFILNWIGSRDKDLQKYKDLYDEMGLDSTLEKISRPTFFFPDTFGHLAALRTVGKLEKLLKGHSGERVIFHCMSGTGLLTFSNILKILKKDKLEKICSGGSIAEIEELPISKISGVILDSSPPYVSREGMKRGLLSGIAHVKNKYLKNFVSSVLDLWLTKLNPGFVKSLEGRFNESKYGEMQLMAPQLYLYSKDDDIVPYKAVEDFAESQRNVGIDVRMKCWEKSKHVQHLRYHREEYKETIESFIFDVMVAESQNREEKRRELEMEIERLWEICEKD